MPIPELPIGPFEPLEPAERARSLGQTVGNAEADAPLWVFAYGSLAWRDCFEPVTKTRAVLDGYARRFCIWTALARGTPQRPGLGLGLMPGPGQCEGVLLEVPRVGRHAALEALWAREMFTGIYRPTWVEPRAGGQPRPAITFVVEPTHPQYAADLTDPERAAVIAGAVGELGPCREYLDNTIEALGCAGISDPELVHLARMVEAIPGA